MFNINQLFNINNLKIDNAENAIFINSRDVNQIQRLAKKALFDKTQQESKDITTIEDEYTEAAKLAGKLDTDENDNASQEVTLDDLPSDFVESALGIYMARHGGSRNIAEYGRLRTEFRNGGYKEVINSEAVKNSYMNKIQEKYINENSVGFRHQTQNSELAAQFRNSEEYADAMELFDSIANNSINKNKSDKSEEKGTKSTKKISTFSDLPSDLVQIAFGVYMSQHGGSSNIADYGRLRTEFLNGGYREVLNSNAVKNSYIQKVRNDYISNESRGFRHANQNSELSEKFNSSDSYKEMMGLINSLQNIR